MSNSTPGKSNRELTDMTMKNGTGTACRPIDLDALLRFNPAFRDSPELLRRFIQLQVRKSDAGDKP